MYSFAMYAPMIHFKLFFFLLWEFFSFVLIICHINNLSRKQNFGGDVFLFILEIINDQLHLLTVMLACLTDMISTVRRKKEIPLEVRKGIIIFFLVLLNIQIHKPMLCYCYHLPFPFSLYLSLIGVLFVYLFDFDIEKSMKACGNSAAKFLNVLRRVVS